MFLNRSLNIFANIIAVVCRPNVDECAFQEMFLDIYIRSTCDD